MFFVTFLYNRNYKVSKFLSSFFRPPQKNYLVAKYINNLSDYPILPLWES